MIMDNIWDEIISLSQGKEMNEEAQCAIQPGALCPICGKADLKYNGTLSLVCPNYGAEFSGSFT